MEQEQREARMSEPWVLQQDVPADLVVEEDGDELDEMENDGDVLNMHGGMETEDAKMSGLLLSQETLEEEEEGEEAEGERLVLGMQTPEMTEGQAALMRGWHHQVYTDAPSLERLAEEEAWEVGHEAFGEYQQDQLAYYLALERYVHPPSDYLKRVQQSIKPWMRQMTVEWMFEACEYFGMTSDSCVVAVQLLDRFLATKPVHKGELQKYGAACVLVSSKLRETAIPRLGDLVDSAGEGFDERALKRAEQDVLRTLQWNLLVASPHTLFVLLSSDLPVRSKEEQVCVRKHAEFFLDLCACEYAFLRYLPSVITASSILLSADMLGLPRQAILDALFARVEFDQDQLAQCQREIQDLFNSTFDDSDAIEEEQASQTRGGSQDRSDASSNGSSPKTHATSIKLESSCSASPSLVRVLTPTSIVESHSVFAPIAHRWSPGSASSSSSTSASLSRPGSVMDLDLDANSQRMSPPLPWQLVEAE